MFNLIYEQIQLGRLKRHIRQAALARIRDRHRRRHPKKTENSPH
ncbi:hypothetical protein [Almyronema epifaneia]|uniref:Uncharacterized protein n=1 Tax=Almyronema epifaneia S1 TaxID=2991925 RepID=A0ABW6III4_9CYAN